MWVRRKQIDREWVSGVIIYSCLIFTLFLMGGMRLLDVKMSNIELVDRGLYTIITTNGPININQDDILRVEKTFTPVSLSGVSIEKDKIFTTKGFIYISSADSFFKIGQQLISNFDFMGSTVWIRSSNGAGILATQTQLAKNLRLVKPYNFAIGTSPKLVNVVFSILSLQYLTLAIGGSALMFLIFPLRFESLPVTPNSQQEPEYQNDDEEHLGAVAK